MAEYDGTSIQGVQEVLSRVTLPDNAVFFFLEYASTQPKRVGYYYLTRGETSGLAMGVTNSGILYRPGTTIVPASLLDTATAVFSLWVRWDEAGLDWHVFT